VERACAIHRSFPVELHTQVFAWYNLVGSFATATGALCGRGLIDLPQHLPPKKQPRLVQPRGHRSSRQVQYRRQPSIGPSFDITEHQNFSKFDWEST
jgi:hypothetical protein